MSFDQFVTFVYGLLIGSFLNVVIHRLPLGKGLVMERSHCPKCKKMIFWYENIPLFSYFFLLGRCSKCKNPIKFRYPMVELIAGLGTLWTYKSVNPLASGMWLDFILLSLMFYIFISHFFIDLDHHILPDSLNLILLILMLIFVIPKYSWNYWALGSIFGFGSTFLMTYLFYKLRGQIGLGGGDIKLYGILGLILGPIGIFQNIFLSSMLGAITMLFLMGIKKKTKNEPMAFGPSIIVIAILQIYFSSFFSKSMALIGQ